MRLILFMLVVLSIKLHAQTDHIFWFAVPEISQNTGPYDEDILINLNSFSKPTTVTVDKPADPSFTPITIALLPNSSQALNLSAWKDDLECKPENTILNYGLRIQADEPIMAYYEVRSNYCNCNPEIFSLKGQNAMGKSFFVPGQNFLENFNSISPSPYNSFDIIATEDDTEIIIIPSNNASGISSGDTVTINLNMGQTYSVRALSQEAEFHLGGSEVYSNKPISITIKDDFLAGTPFLGGCRDLGGDQIVPTERLGTDYILINSFLNGPGDQAFVLATEDNTALFSDNNQLTSLEKGEIHQISMGSAKSLFVQADKPVAVLQMSGNGCEIGLAQLPHIACTGSQNISLTRSTDELFLVNLIVPTAGTGSFLINGSNSIINAADFELVQGTDGDWSFTQVSFDTQFLPTGSVLQIENTDHLFHSAIIHGGVTSGTRFGYFSDFSSLDQKLGELDDFYCPGSKLEYLVDSIPGAMYSWTGPNNFTSTNASLLIEDLETADQGSYQINITAEYCADLDKEIELKVVNNVFIDLPEDTTLCAGEQYLLSAISIENEIDYSWTNTNNSIIEDSVLNISSFGEVDTGLYVLAGTHPNCPVIPDSIVLSLDPSFYTSASISSPIICQNGTVEINVINEYSNPTWYGPNNFEYNGNSFTLEDIQFSDTGLYYFIDQDAECGTISDTVSLSITNLLQLEAKLISDSLCIGEDAELYVLPANQGYDLQWSGPNGFISSLENPILNQLGTENEGPYILTGFSNECTLIPDTVFLHVFSDTFLTAIYPDTICENTELTILVDPILDADYSINWGQGNTLFTSNLPINITGLSPSGPTPFYLNASNWICPVEGDSFNIYIDPTLQTSIQISEDSTCIGQTVEIAANYFEGIDYLWTGPNGFESTDSSISLEGLEVENTGYYILNLDGDACIGEADSTYLYVFPSLDPQLFYEKDSLCEEEELIFGIQDIADFNVNWTGPFNQVYEGNTVNISSVGVENAGLYTLNVDGYPCPFPEVELPIYVENNPLIIINDSICANYFYELPNAELAEFPGTYLINETTELGCLQELQVNLSPKDCLSCFYLPNVFTPDNDGINDRWAPILRCPAVYYTCEIYDRWGNQVFSTKQHEQKWDGKINGLDASPSVYVWRCTVQFEGQINPIELKGSLSLVR